MDKATLFPFVIVRMMLDLGYHNVHIKGELKNYPFGSQWVIRLNGRELPILDQPIIYSTRWPFFILQLIVIQQIIRIFVTTHFAI